ncbi:MAG: DUF3810 domain-containing protein [Bacteroidetes bacterium]|nr:DUF3810 domain-containing protein [Bacteroidota bacterium]
MKVRLKLFIAGILMAGCAAIHVYAGDPMRVETGYSSRFSPWFSNGLRILFGKVPFSFGDILYGLLLIWMVWKFVRFLGRMIRKGRVSSRRVYLGKALLSTVIFCSSMYLLFNISWGINYDREGIAWQLGLKPDKYSKSDLEEINCLLVDKINQSKKELVREKAGYPENEMLIREVADAYKVASNDFTFLRYEPVSIKPSVWGWLGNYTGFTGYYNPFTGEAQVNTTVPEFLHPFIVCHEVAHQLGYAKEMEANFVGYLAGSRSDNELIRYSTYLDLFIYSNRNLAITDTTQAKLYRKDLDKAVIADLQEWVRFLNKHRSPVEPIFRWIYGKYLENNGQPQGLMSYDEVTGLLVAYYKKYGRL